MRRFHLFLAAVLLLAPAAKAQIDSATLSVSLDHPDWRYHVGEPVHFRISLSRSGQPISGARVIATLAPVRMKPIRVDTLDLTGGTVTVTGTLHAPDFLRLSAVYFDQGTRHTALGTAGFNPERMTATTTMPADFESFWQQAIADMRKIPLAPVMTRLPERSTPEVDVYHVSFQNQRVGSRIYGMLSVPTKPGKYPAMLVVPGAGVRPYFPDVDIARRGVIHLAIGIHGIPVDRDSLLYNELRATALQNYWTYGIESRDSYYYKRVFVGVVKAGDFIFSLPQFDGTNYVVEGGSQGGGLSLVLGALDPRVKAIGVSYPAMADQFGYFSGHAGGWPHIFNDTTGMRALPEKIETIRYYDAVNFARLVKVPVFYTFGYNDNTVPPNASWATYNTITAPKELLIVPETGHFQTKAQTDAKRAWLLARLGIR
jgi:cephalosporin-C deacetylase-like acetyl esterase